MTAPTPALNDKDELLAFVEARLSEKDFVEKMRKAFERLTDDLWERAEWAAQDHLFSNAAFNLKNRICQAAIDLWTRAVAGEQAAINDLDGAFAPHGGISFAGALGQLIAALPDEVKKRELLNLKERAINAIIGNIELRSRCDNYEKQARAAKAAMREAEPLKAYPQILAAMGGEDPEISL